METDRESLGKESERPRENRHPPLSLETANLGPACWFMVNRRALAPVAKPLKPGLAPNGSLNQQSSLGGAAEGAKAGEGLLQKANASCTSPTPLLATLPAGG